MTNETKLVPCYRHYIIAQDACPICKGREDAAALATARSEKQARWDKRLEQLRGN